MLRRKRDKRIIWLNNVELVCGIVGALLLFIPFNSSYNSWYRGQYMLLLYTGGYLLVWLVLIMWRKVIASNKIRICGNWLDCIVIGMVLYLFIRACIDFEYSGMMILQIGVACLAYYCFRNIPRKFFIWYIRAFLMGGVVQILFSLHNQGEYFAFSERFSRIYGSFLNPSVWGNYLALLLVMEMGMLWHRMRWKWKVLWMVVLLLTIFLLWQSNSRTGWVAAMLGAGTLFYKIYVAKKMQQWSRRKRFLLMAAVLILLSLYGNMLYTYKKDSSDGRLFIWRVSCDLIKDAPCWGHGVNGFRRNYMMYQSTYFKQNPVSAWRKVAGDNCFAFNEYIRFAVEYGLITVILFIIVGGYVLIKKTKSKSKRIVLSKCLLLTLGVIAIFSYPFFLWQYVILLLFFLSGANGEARLNLPAYIERYSRNLFVIMVAFMMILFIGGGMVGEKTVRLYNDGVRLYRAKQYEGAKEKFLQCMEQYPDYNLTLLLGEVCIDLQEYVVAEYYFKLAADMIPGRIKPHFYLFKLYREFCREKALQEALTIKEILVKVYSPQLNTIYKEVDAFMMNFETLNK